MATDNGTPVRLAALGIASSVLGGIIAGVATIIGTIVGFYLPLVVHKVTDPPPITTVLALMDQEVDAGMRQDLGIVDRIYTSNATVTDAACRTAGASRSWHGRGEIETRYKDLPRFESLHHVDTHVTWAPPDQTASRAEATADTIGVIAPTGTSPMGQAIYGHEVWVFVKSGHAWAIQSFIYNVCLQ